MHNSTGYGPDQAELAADAPLCISLAHSDGVRYDDRYVTNDRTVSRSIRFSKAIEKATAHMMKYTQLRPYLNSEKARIIAYAPYTVPILVQLALAAIIRQHGQLPYPDSAFSSWDHYRYIAMATHPLGNDPLVRQAPFCWRILTPWIVHLIPAPVTIGFWIVTLVGLISATVGLMWFLLALGLSPSSVVIGGLAFALLPPATSFTLWDYMLVDPLAFALLTLALACAVSRRGPWLFVALALYAFDKETVLLVALFALAYALEERDWRMLRWSTAGAVVSGAIQFGLHVAIHSDQPYSLLAQYQLVQSMYGERAVTVLARILDTFGASWLLLLPLAALQLLHPPRLFARPSFLLMFTGATAQVVVATDTSRVVVYAFPVVIAAFLHEIEYLAKLVRVPYTLLGGSVLAVHLLWFIQQAALVGPAMLGMLTTGVVAVEFVTVFVTISVSACASYYWGRRLGSAGLSP